MLHWLAENWGTLLVSLLLIGIVVLIVVRLRRDKRQGKSPCGGSCGCCPMAGSCHRKA